MKTHIGIAALGIFDGGVCGEKNINYDSYNDNDNNDDNNDNNNDDDDDKEPKESKIDSFFNVIKNLNNQEEMKCQYQEIRN